jgi:hypothetical protein
MAYFVLTFQSTHHVMKAEKILLQAGIKHEIIPTPKNISSECGMSVRISDGDFNVDVETLMVANRIQVRISQQD